MDETIGARISRAWNAFRSKGEEFVRNIYEIGSRSSSRPDRSRFSVGNERSIISSVYNRLALDVASTRIQHVIVDDNGRFLDNKKSKLNDCLTVAANIDQTSAAFMQDVAMSLFDEGCIAIVPIDTTIDPRYSDAYDVESMRVAKIKEWFPRAVKVEVYNDRTGLKEDVTLPKTAVAIVENPLYAVMNEPNSTLKRLIAKLNMLDAVDSQSSSGKLDLIIQLPYLIKTEARKKQAEARKADIEEQLSGSKYGIAYTDATEKVVQLNRPTENNLMKQIEYLTSMLYSQLGLTTSIMDGTADEATMLNYYRRTIEPVLNAIVDSMGRTFISKTGRTQGQRLMAFSDPFRLVPMSALSDIADKFTRNEILSSNDVRAIIGMKPSKAANADELRNKNISPSQPTALPAAPTPTPPITPEGGITLDEA